MRKYSAAALAVLIALYSPAASASPFATRVIAYDPAPGQRVQDAAFNTPARALGAPVGGGLSTPDNSKVVTLGGFGGSITLGFDHPIYANRHNPFGMDFIVYGNGLYVDGNPRTRYAECGVIEVSKDVNGNGLADDPWYVVPGSHLPAGVPLSRTSKVYDAGLLTSTWVPPGRSGMWTVSAYQLGGPPFSGGPILSNADPVVEAVWGYADLMPTLLLGDTNADDEVDNPAATPEAFYTRPDDPHAVGVTPGSGGGSAISIRWAVNPTTGLAPVPALVRIDFVRITTAVDLANPLIGEASTEVAAVADAAPVYTADWNGDGRVSVQDVFDFLADWFARAGEAGGGDFNNSGATTVQDVFDFLGAWFAG